MDIKNALISYSQSINIDDIGFCLAKPFYEIKDILCNREKDDYMCELESKDYDKKIYPELTLEGAKSFIITLEAYNDNPRKITDGTLRGNISMAAVSMDYHKIVMSKLQKLENYLHTLVDCNTKAFVDTGPFSDRAIARRAGLGFIGKNSMLVTEKFGSKVYIGYILTDYAIEPDDKLLPINCDGCDRCIRACPTGAIADNYQVNCQKCISYLTQHKGDISKELKKKMGQQIYGCDVCQSVCPYNEVSNKKLVDAVDPYPEYGGLLGISNKAFKETYGQSSAGWRGKKLLQRNAIIALGNSRSYEALGILEGNSDDMRIDIRREIVEAIVNLSFLEGIRILEKMKEKEKDKALLALIEDSIVKLKKE